MSWQHGCNGAGYCNDVVAMSGCALSQQGCSMATHCGDMAWWHCGSWRHGGQNQAMVTPLQPQPAPKRTYKKKNQKKKKKERVCTMNIPERRGEVG
jgi:hypothetical protein